MPRTSKLAILGGRPRRVAPAPSPSPLAGALGARAHWLLQRIAGRLTARRPRAHLTKGGLFDLVEAALPSTLESLTGGGPILILAPHPDDETLGCGGLIAACRGAGVPVYVAFLTDGARSHPGSKAWPPNRIAAERRQEVVAAMNILGVEADALTFLPGRDGRLLFSLRARRKLTVMLLRLARKLQIRRLYATWVHDPHPDHVATALIARSVCRRLPHVRLMSYPIWGRFLPNAIVLRDKAWRPVKFDVRPFQSLKRAALAAHRTQTTTLIEDARRNRGLSDDHVGELLSDCETYFI